MGEGRISRAKQLRNDDADRVCMQANGYFLGDTPEGDLVIAFDLGGKAEAGIFFDRNQAHDFLDRFTAEMDEKGWLS